MTIAPKLMSTTEVAEWSRVALLANPIERSAVQKLLSHIAAQDQRIAELEALAVNRGRDAGLRLSIATELNVADRKLIAELRAGLAKACNWIADRSSDESLLVDRLRALIPTDTTTKTCEDE